MINLAKYRIFIFSFLLIIPIINLGFDFFLTSTTYRANLVFVHYFILFVFIILFYIFNDKPTEKIDLIIYLFLSYLFISVSFSSDYFESLNYFIKVS
ncbi:hypothetical protein, partial [Pleomorphovibrio marinus]|uniref:hypothetical protein n=1 Tax=Pleomorphovibrio marinus TaxID=2164132 RepID=UPI001E630E9A